MERRLSSTVSETDGLKYTLYLSLIIWVVLVICFEYIRHMKLMFLKRVTKKFLVCNKFCI
jgi:hypothetical protein